MTYKNVYILMTQYPGFDAKILRWYSRFPYTHTSIGFEEDMDTFYTFVSNTYIRKHALFLSAEDMQKAWKALF